LAASPRLRRDSIWNVSTSGCASDFFASTPTFPAHRSQCARPILDGRGRPLVRRFHRRSGTTDVPCARESTSTFRQHCRSVPWLSTRFRHHPALVFGFDAGGVGSNCKLPPSIDAVGDQPRRSRADLAAMAPPRGFAFLSYLSPRGLPRLFAWMTNQIPVARHRVPCLVYVTFDNAIDSILGNVKQDDSNYEVQQ